MLRVLSLALAFMLLGTGAASAQDVASISAEALIDALQESDETAPGIDSTAVYQQFLGDDSPAQLSVGQLPPHPPSASPPMRELVRRGVTVLPALIAHLRDARPTRITVGTADHIVVFGGQFFSDEYDARYRKYPDYGCTALGPPAQCPSFTGIYTIKVGDVCEMLIGQIVNRDLYAARYQPTAILYVISPVVTPILARRIARDWRGLTPKAHAASLLADIRAVPVGDWLYNSAFVRLRFYYPKIYAALTGTDAIKRAQFEADEASRRARQ